MGKKQKLILYVVSAFALTACSDNWTPASDEVTGLLEIGEVEVVNLENVTGLKSMDTSDFTVTVTDSRGTTLGQWVYAEIPGFIELPVGEGYSVKIASDTQEKQAWDSPYFEGVSEKFSVEEGETVRIDPIECKLANMKISVRYTDRLLEVMDPDCIVNVLANDEGYLRFTTSEMRIGYFQIIDGSRTMVATFTGTVHGCHEELYRVFTDISGGMHYRLTYDLKSDSETNSGEIQVSVVVVDESVEGNVLTSDDEYTTD